MATLEDLFTWAYRWGLEAADWDLPTWKKEAYRLIVSKTRPRKGTPVECARFPVYRSKMDVRDWDDDPELEVIYQAQFRLGELRRSFGFSAAPRADFVRTMRDTQDPKPGPLNEVRFFLVFPDTKIYNMVTDNHILSFNGRLRSWPVLERQWSELNIKMSIDVDRFQLVE